VRYAAVVRTEKGGATVHYAGTATTVVTATASGPVRDCILIENLDAAGVHRHGDHPDYARGTNSAWQP